MRVEPSFEAVAARYDKGRPSVVWTRLVADLETPVSAMLKLCDGKPMSFLFESVEGGATRGRYSLIGTAPTSSGAAAATRPRSTDGRGSMPTTASYR